jgi:hypothetical protein
MYSFLAAILRALNLNSDSGIADHRSRGRYRLRAALRLACLGLASLMLDVWCIYAQHLLADQSLLRIAVDWIQMGAQMLSAVGLCTAATAFICGIYEVAMKRAWYDLSKTVRWLLLLVGIPLLMAAPVIVASTVVERWR